MSPLPSGFAIGHWTDQRAQTGCTVIRMPQGTVGGCDVRGGSPGSRELALLASEKKMQEVHALLLTGGSAFGLAAADGVMRFLEEQGIGYATPWARVPIVPAAVIFDLNVGSSSIRPTADAGYAAARAVSSRGIAEGTVGVGTGATVGKWGGMEGSMRGGFGLDSVNRDGLIVTAAAAVNAVGDILDEKGEIIAGARTPEGTWRAGKDPLRTMVRGSAILHAHTVLVALLTNARLTKVEVNRVAQRGHDGVARAVKPAHTSYDGDVVFCFASNEVEADMDLVAEWGAEATARAIRRAVSSERAV